MENTIKEEQPPLERMSGGSGQPQGQSVTVIHVQPTYAPLPPQPPQTMNPCCCCCCPQCNLRANCIAIGIIFLLSIAMFWDLTYIQDSDHCIHDENCKIKIKVATALMCICPTVDGVTGILLLVAALARKRGAALAAMACFLLSIVCLTTMRIFVLVTIKEVFNAKKPIGPFFQNASLEELQNYYRCLFIVGILYYVPLCIYFAVCSYAFAKQIALGVDRLPHNPGRRLGAGAATADPLSEAPPPDYTPSHTQSYYINQPGANPYYIIQ